MRLAAVGLRLMNNQKIPKYLRGKIQVKKEYRKQLR